MSARRPSGAGDRAETLWYSASPVATAARAALRPLSALFGVGVNTRTAIYDAGIARIESSAVPVVSVGALRVGGAGKTPFVLWLARELRRRGRRPCIVTRGYGGTAGGKAPWVLGPAAARTPGSAERAGDEAVLLALRSGRPVAIGADRARACAHAASTLAGTVEAPDVFVLDDGFQHRRLSRALDIVLVTGSESRERLLPAGPLRESVRALARADVVVTMSSWTGPRASPSPAVSSAALCIDAFARPVGLVDEVSNAETRPLAELAGRRVVAVAGIARPDRFFAELERAGASLVAKVKRRDHHRYDDADLREIDAAARTADLVVTTEKDLVKLDGSRLQAPLAALRIEIAFASEADEALLAGRAAGLSAV